MIVGICHSIESLRAVGVHDECSVVDGVDGAVGAAAAHRGDVGRNGAAAAHRDVTDFVGGLCLGRRKNISCLSRAIYCFTRSNCSRFFSAP